MPCHPSHSFSCKYYYDLSPLPEMLVARLILIQYRSNIFTVNAHVRTSNYESSEHILGDEIFQGIQIDFKCFVCKALINVIIKLISIDHSTSKIIYVITVGKI